MTVHDHSPQVSPMSRDITCHPCPEIRHHQAVVVVGQKPQDTLWRPECSAAEFDSWAAATVCQHRRHVRRAVGSERSHRHRHPQPACRAQRLVERSAAAAAADDARGRSTRRCRRHHPDGCRPRVLRWARPEGTRLGCWQHGASGRRWCRRRRRPRPVSHAVEADHRRDQWRRGHGWVRAGTQLRLPDRVGRGKVR